MARWSAAWWAMASQAIRTARPHLCLRRDETFDGVVLLVGSASKRDGRPSAADDGRSGPEHSCRNSRRIQKNPFKRPALSGGKKILFGKLISGKEAVATCNAEWGMLLGILVSFAAKTYLRVHVWRHCIGPMPARCAGGRRERHGTSDSALCPLCDDAASTSGCVRMGSGRLSGVARIRWASRPPARRYTSQPQGITVMTGE